MTDSQTDRQNEIEGEREPQLLKIPNHEFPNPITRPPLHLYYHFLDSIEKREVQWWPQEGKYWEPMGTSHDSRRVLVVNLVQECVNHH